MAGQVPLPGDYGYAYFWQCIWKSCNRIYNFLLNKRLLNPRQFAFCSFDPCVNQLFTITHKIFESFDCYPSLEVRSGFLDIFEAFDKVLHKGLLCKLKSMGISGERYEIIGNYLSGRFQIVILNWKTSSWRPILASVPQNSVLGLLLFLIYFDDLSNGLRTNAKLFADDISLFTIVKVKNKSANALNNDLFLI